MSSYKWSPLIAICLGAFILLVDVTIVNVALPRMAVELGASMSSLQWVVDAYALALAALLLAAGSAADLLGRRRVYLAGLAVFAVASLICAVAPNAAVLIAGRAVQGAGGAAMFATTTALLSTTYAGRDRAIAFSVWAAVSGGAAATGPIVGGLLVQAFGWPSIFLVNLPIAAVAIVLSVRFLGESRGARARFDAPGAVTFTSAITALVAGLIHSGESGWARGETIALLAAGVVLLAAFAVVELRSTHPLLDLRLFRRPAFTGLMAAAMVLPAAAFAHLGFTSVWLQSVLGLDPLRAGLVVVPLSAAAFTVATVAGRALQSARPHRPVGAGLALIGVGTLTLTTITPDSGWPVLVAGLVLVGLGVGTATGPLVSAALAVVPPEHAGLAGGAVNTFRQLGHAMGVAVLGSLFVAGASGALTGRVGDPHAIAAALGGGQAPRLSLDPTLVRTAFSDGLDHAYLVAGAAALVAAALVTLLARDRSPVPTR